MFPCRNGNNYEVSLARPTRQAFCLKTFTPHIAPYPPGEKDVTHDR